MRPIPTLKISISGVRGVIGESLTPILLTRFAQAFGTYTGARTIVIGRDPRTSGEMVKQAVIAGLLSSGCRILDIGMCPVPSAAAGASPSPAWRHCNHRQPQSGRMERP